MRFSDSDAVAKFRAKTSQIANIGTYRQNGPRCAHIFTLRHDSSRAGVWTDAVQETSSQATQTPNMVLQVRCLYVPFYLGNFLKNGSQEN